MLKYLDNPFLYQDNAKIISLNDNEIILNQTIFYPKGGGQPNDIGSISSKDINFDVKEVFNKDGLIHHIGKYNSNLTFKIGDTVQLNVNKQKRLEHSAIHTLGHLIDEAMLNLGYYNDITPYKAFHYPEGPSVEYLGNLSKYDLDNLKTKIENEVNRMLSIGFETKSFFISSKDINNYCHKVTVNNSILNNSDDKNIRVVIVWGNKGITCMGTHIKNINQIKGIIIPKITNKKGIVKFSYRLTEVIE